MQCWFPISNISLSFYVIFIWWYLVIWFLSHPVFSVSNFADWPLDYDMCTMIPGGHSLIMEHKQICLRHWPVFLRNMLRSFLSDLTKLWCWRLFCCIVLEVIFEIDVSFFKSFFTLCCCAISRYICEHHRQLRPNSFLMHQCWQPGICHVPLLKRKITLYVICVFLQNFSIDIICF